MTPQPLLEFEDEVPQLWLRWCDREGQVIPTGAGNHQHPWEYPQQK